MYRFCGVGEFFSILALTLLKGPLGALLGFHTDEQLLLEPLLRSTALTLVLLRRRV